MPEFKQDEIIALTKKLMQGSITDAEFTRLESWYAANPDSPPTWTLKDHSKNDLEQRMLRQIKSRFNKPKSIIYRRWTQIAAAVLVLITAGLYFYNNTTVLNQTHLLTAETADNQIKKIHLPDESIVWLKGNSHLEYPKKFTGATRNVILTGEALFEVSKDRKHPFIIRSGKYLTQVLGTSFNIKENSQNNSFKLVVLTGKVLVSAAGTVVQSFKPVLVTPEKEFELAGTKLAPVITAANMIHKDAVISGTEYKMEFENEKFDLVKRRIEQKFGVAIISDNQQYRNCNLSANLTDQSLENTLKVICSAINATYTIKDNSINITGGGCN